MNFSPYVLTTLLLFACTPGQKDPGGTAVGNPGEATMRLGENEDFTWNDASARLSELIVTDCEGSEEVVTLNEEFSFLGEDAIPLPPGNHCAFRLVFDGLMQVHGETEPDTTFTMTLAIPNDEIAVYTTGGVNIDETITILEMSSPNLLSEEDLNLIDGDETLFTETSELSEFYADTIASQSALWLDVDDDGDVSSAERAAGPISAGDEWEPEEKEDEEDGQGCGGDGEEGWLFLALTPLLFRRRSTVNRPNTSPIR